MFSAFYCNASSNGVKKKNELFFEKNSFLENESNKKYRYLFQTNKGGDFYESLHGVFAIIHAYL